jgi:hypothetical protein
MICLILLIVGAVTGSSNRGEALLTDSSTGGSVVETSSSTAASVVAAGSSTGAAAVVAGISTGEAVLATSSSTRIAVLDLLRRDPDLTEDSIFQKLSVSDPTADFEEVVRTVDEVNFYSRVPSYFHTIVQTYVTRGGTRPDDPEVLEAILANNPRTTDRQFIQNAVKHWIDLCIYPSIHFLGACCNVDPADPLFWRLTWARKIFLVETLIYQSMSPTSDAIVAAERLYRGDMSSQSISG